MLINGGDRSVDLDEVENLLSTQTHGPVATHMEQGEMPGFDLPLRQAREQYERAYLTFHLNQSNGSVGKVAKLAGMERTHLYRKLRSLGIDTKQISPLSKD